MPNLPPLDAERLEELAREQREIAKRCDEMGIAHHALELAAMCEAFAGAERAMRAMAPDVVFKVIGGELVADRLSDRHGLRRTGEIGRGPTLLAALASVAKQEEPNDA